MTQVLVLNASYEPLNVVGINRALNLVVAGKASTIEVSGKIAHSAEDVFDVPSVILLNKQVPHRARKVMGFSRKLVLTRDNHTCVYCGRHATTIDHVNPRALGGRNSYENCVACCSKCNSAKGSKTLAQMGWTLPKNPKAPSPYAVLLNKAPQKSGLADVWKGYISVYGG